MQLNFSLFAAPDQVFPFLAEAGRFVSVHPLIIEMTPEPGGSFRVRERMGSGFLAVTFTYRAWIEADPSTRIVRMRALIFGMVRLELQFDLKLSSGGGTLVRETVKIRAPWPVPPVLMRVLRWVHPAMFRAIERACAVA